MTAIDLAFGALRAARAASRARRDGVYREWAALVTPGGVSPASPGIDWTAAHHVFLTLAKRPHKGEEIVLELQGKEIPRADYRLLEDCVTGDLCIYKADATWVDCCTATVRFQKARVAA